MTIGELIGLASTVLALPGSIVAVIELWQMFKPGHGRHRKCGQRRGPRVNRGATPHLPRPPTRARGMGAGGRARAHTPGESTRKGTTMTAPNRKPQEYLSLAGFAQRVGLSPGTLASYTRKNLLPDPDVIITDGQGGRQIRGWTPATIDYWTTHRVGRGYRSDLRRPKNT